MAATLAAPGLTAEDQEAVEKAVDQYRASFGAPDAGAAPGGGGPGVVAGGGGVAAGVPAAGVAGGADPAPVGVLLPEATAAPPGAAGVAPPGADAPEAEKE